MKYNGIDYEVGDRRNFFQCASSCSTDLEKIKRVQAFFMNNSENENEDLEIYEVVEEFCINIHNVACFKDVSKTPINTSVASNENDEYIDSYDSNDLEYTSEEIDEFISEHSLIMNQINDLKEDLLSGVASNFYYIHRLLKKAKKSDLSNILENVFDSNYKGSKQDLYIHIMTKIDEAYTDFKSIPVLNREIYSYLSKSQPQPSDSLNTTNTNSSIPANNLHVTGSYSSRTQISN